MSPPRSPKTPRAQGPTSADGEAEQLVQSGTIEVVDVVQPQVAVPIHDEAHQPLGSEPVEAILMKLCEVRGLTQAPLCRVLLPQMCR